MENLADWYLIQIVSLAKFDGYHVLENSRLASRSNVASVEDRHVDDGRVDRRAAKTAFRLAGDGFTRALLLPGNPRGTFPGTI